MGGEGSRDVGELIYLKGPETNGVKTASGPMRQPDYASDGVGGAGLPVSHIISLGQALRALLPKIEQRMNENAITNP